MPSLPAAPSSVRVAPHRVDPLTTRQHTGPFSFPILSAVVRACGPLCIAKSAIEGARSTRFVLALNRRSNSSWTKPMGPRGWVRSTWWQLSKEQLLKIDSWKQAVIPPFCRCLWLKLLLALLYVCSIEKKQRKFRKKHLKNNCVSEIGGHMWYYLLVTLVTHFISFIVMVLIKIHTMNSIGLYHNLLSYVSK